jgi:orotate phosphoribosyltransferase
MSDTLVQLVREKALEFGQFTLASGKQASYYLDCRRLTLDSQAINSVADALLDLLEPAYPDAVGGLELGAVPITAAMLSRAAVRGRTLRGFVVRKEAKQYGKGKRIEGPVRAGEHVVIVEDVVTTGGSSLQAIDACREAGLIVEGVMAVIDRLDGAADTFTSMGLPFRPLLTIRDLGLESDPDSRR